MDGEGPDKVRELERENELLRGEVARLKAALAKGSGTVRDMLRRRGFSIYRKGRGGGIIQPSPAADREPGEFYGWMKKYSFRLFLRDVIQHKHGFRPGELVRYSSLPVVERYCGYMLDAGILAGSGGGEYRLEAAEDIRSFGPTLEWFVCEVFRREFMADAVWGVKFKGTSSGGDYDVIAAVEGRLLYAEVKSSPPKQIYAAEVGAFIGRVFELCPDISLFIVDTELRMKDKVAGLFEEAMPGGPLAGRKVERLKDELFHVDGSLFIVNSRNGLVENIGEVLGRYLRRS